MHPSSRFSLLLIAALVALVLVAQASGAGTKRCDISRDGRKLGPTYVTSLRVTAVSCSTGKRLVKAYYRCRVRDGGRKGRCHGRPLGYRCSERRLNAIPTQFDARVSCSRGRARVVHTYTQFT